jgi:restriction system protein
MTTTTDNTNLRDVLGSTIHPLLHTMLSVWWVWAFLACVGLAKLAIAVRAQRRLAKSGISEIDRMDGLTFERRMSLLFKAAGFSVELTRARGDYGADLVLERNGVKTVVQAKRWTKRVGVKAVQEAVAAKAMYGCTEAMVVTNSTFTNQACELARVNGVELWARERLVRELFASAPLVAAPATVLP